MVSYKLWVSLRIGEKQLNSRYGLKLEDLLMNQKCIVKENDVKGNTH